MKCFSPKKTLSNFATAVRETVAFMNLKIFVTAVAASFSMTALYTNALTAVTPTGTHPSETTKAIQETRKAAVAEFCDEKKKGFNKDLCEDARQGLSNSLRAGGQNVREKSCEKIAENIEKIEKDAKTACSDAGFSTSLDSCFDTAKTCEKAEDDLLKLEPDDEGGEAPYCNKILAETCPAIPTLNMSTDFKQEKKQAETERKELKKELDGLLEEQRKFLKDKAATARETEEKRQNDALTARRHERALLEKMTESLENLSESQKKSMESAQDAFSQMEAEFMKMRKEARDSTAAVEQARDDLQLTCRASADKKYQEAEKVRLATLAMRKKNVGAAVSGSSKRLKAATARARAVDFLAFFNECTAGLSPDGVGGTNRIRTAERAKASAEKFLEEKAALIEKQRAQMGEKLKAMEAEAPNKRDKIVQDIQKQLDDANEARSLTAQQNQARMNENQLNDRLNEESLKKRIEAANDEHKKSELEAKLAQSRMKCAGRIASHSEAKRTKYESDYKDGPAKIKEAARLCSRLSTSCSVSADATPYICNSVLATVSGARKIKKINVDSKTDK